MNKEDQAIEDIINKMLEIAGYDMVIDDIIEEDRKDWFSFYTMTHKEHDEWETWTKDYLKKKFKWSKTKIDEEFSWFDLLWGLKIDDT